MRPASHFTSTFVLLSVLWLVGGWSIGVVPSVRAEPDIRTVEPVFQVSDSLLLDQYPDSYAAYSLRKLRSDYNGPVVRVRRSSDDAEQDIGFAADGFVDTAAIESFIGSGDGYVTTWYAQVSGTPDLTQGTASKQPRIAQGGTVETDAEEKPIIFFDGSESDYLEASGFSSSIPQNDYTMFGVLSELNISGETSVFGIGTLNNNHWLTASYRYWASYARGSSNRLGEGSGMVWEKRDMVIMRNTGSVADLWQGNTKYDESTNSGLSDNVSDNAVSVGSGYTGGVSEVAFYPSVSESEVLDFYRNVTMDWDVGPVEWNQQALMPQNDTWQVTLYDWLETLTVEDVTLPDGTLQYDNSYSTEDELADLWLQVEGLTASSVTRAEPEWYTLDAGNGKGIEATGSVKANHNPKGGGYGGNPPRSWQNEPAFWYQLDLPLSGGEQGNPWYQDPAMGRRAMAVSIVDLIMHQGLDETASFNWYDMKGKAFLGMAEAYRWSGDVMTQEAQDAYEAGMEAIVDDLTARGPRAVNTNMDMFALQGAADLYMATDDAVLKQKCVEMVKKALFGYKDGALDTKHKVFKAASDQDGGVFDPSGFIMEGDQPDVFYGGESIYHLTGALQAVTDRSDGSVPSEWSFLEEVVRRLQEWRTYQLFYDPVQNSPAVGGLNDDNLMTAGAGFSGRTGSGVPAGQANKDWKMISTAHLYENDAFKAQGILPTVGDMETQINNKLSSMNSKMSSVYTANTPDDWSGWSPWTKATPYLPPEGWYSSLKTLKQSSDPKFEKVPAARQGETWNKTFGGGAENKDGDPIGKEYWSYKDTDANGNAFGFFVEAQKYQGGYGGWYGGKIETFWTEETGVLLINRHGKTGCDRSGVDDYENDEDSTCWFNLDEKAGHHVWGRDENGNGFTTLLLRGQELERTSTFDTNGSPPTVAVNNVFNDPNHSETESNTGEQTGTELEGSVEIENKFEAQSSGVKVTHTLTSDETDQVTELWASLPVYLRHYNPYRVGDNRQGNIEDTRIEYWDGSAWVELPFDTDSDGVPEIVSTDALRLGRDYEDGEGIRYGYVSLASTQDLRRSKHKYYDPYQTKTGVRTVHIDLHGNPGTTQTLPASKSVSYTIQTTDPTSEDTSTSQALPLQKGWNIASTSVSPAVPDMDSVFSGLQSEIMVVENEAGERYKPGETVDEIGQWSPKEAYRIFAESDVTLTIQGDSLGSPSITLDEGWNLVPYFPSSALPVEEALSSIVEDLSLVKDERGRAYLPVKDPDVLEQMEPGEGYKIYVQQSTTLTYPDGNN